ncbi:MAG: acyl-CoA dehydrogenase family protein [Chloroflexi bacterium]|nr:acyl-CoA dehydrogenase family protein [Chloroflexota bacterium]
MRAALTPEQDRFQQEVRRYFESIRTPEWELFNGIEDDDAEYRLGVEIDKKLAAKGWLTLHWPKEYGGAAASIMEQTVFHQEKAYFLLPRCSRNGLHFVGPTIMRYGTPEQKARHLPPMSRAEVTWCQLFSEPEAGSDLAAQQTRAERTADGYRVNGQKVWTTYGHISEWGILLARTSTEASKHKGISFFLVDMTTPGMTRRPIPLMGGGAFNEVFFDNVLLPRDALLGEEGQGWYVAMHTLGLQRSVIDNIGRGLRLIDDLVRYARETTRHGVPLARDPLVRGKLAEAAIEIEVGRMLCYRDAWLQERGVNPTYETPLSKTFVAEATQRLSRTAMEVLGLRGQLIHGAPGVQFAGRYAAVYQLATTGTIRAGSAEISRNLIAQRGLGLPRD